MGNKNSGNAAVKNLNLNNVFRSIWDTSPVSRAKISRELKLCPATVSSCVQELADLHYVAMGPKGQSRGGRCPVMVTIEENYYHIASLVVLKEDIIGSLVTLGGRILYKIQRKIPSSRQKGSFDFMGVVSEVLGNLCGEWEVRNLHMLGIGIGMHGIVDYAKGVSVFAPAFETHMVKIKEILESAYGLPVVVDNDVRSMLLSERLYGNYRELKNYIFLGLGDGVGSGIMIDGQVLRGSTSAAGEIGHLKVHEGGRKCLCGNYGCLDTVASTYGLIWDVVENIQMGVPSMLTKFVGKDSLDKISFEMILNAAKQNDNLALLAFERLGMYVGKALAGIINVLNPEAVIIGGKISEGWVFIQNEIKNTLWKQTISDSNKNLRIFKTSFSNSDIAIAGAALVVDKILNSESLRL